MSKIPGHQNHPASEFSDGSHDGYSQIILSAFIRPVIPIQFLAMFSSAILPGDRIKKNLTGRVSPCTDTTYPFGNNVRTHQLYRR